MMQKNKQTILLLLSLAWALFSISCMGDPWPEPDTMENNDKNSGGDENDQDSPTSGDASETDADIDTDGSMDGGDADSDSDIDSDIDGDADSDADGDADADSDTEGQTDDTIAIEDEHTHLLNHVFVSSPNESGLVTIAGLPGAIPVGRTAKCFVGSAVYEIPTGLDRGFAMRVSAGADDVVTIVVTANGDAAAVFSADIVSDDSVLSWDDLIGTASGVTQLNDSYLAIVGRGALTWANSQVVAANVSRSTTAASPTLCDDSACIFNLMLFGGSTDDIDLFFVPLNENVGTAPTTIPIQ